MLELKLELHTHNQHQESLEHAAYEMLISLTVGKVDAGVAVLLTEDKRLVSFHYTPMPPRRHHPSTPMLTENPSRSNFPPSSSHPPSPPAL